MPSIQLMKKARQAVSPIITQEFSVGHFWSPHHATTEGVFCKLFINTEKSTSYKHWISISSKSLIFTQLAQLEPQYTTITGLRLRVQAKDSALRWVFFACTHFSTPVSCADSPFQGHTAFRSRFSRASPLLRFSAKILLTRMTRRWCALTKWKFFDWLLSKKTIILLM